MRLEKEVAWGEWWRYLATSLNMNVPLQMSYDCIIWSMLIVICKNIGHLVPPILIFFMFLLSCWLEQVIIISFLRATSKLVKTCLKQGSVCWGPVLSFVDEPRSGSLLPWSSWDCNRHETRHEMFDTEFSLKKVKCISWIVMLNLYTHPSLV